MALNGNGLKFGEVDVSMGLNVFAAFCLHITLSKTWVILNFCKQGQIWSKMFDGLSFLELFK